MDTGSAEAPELGPRIADAREDAELTQAQLASAIGIDRTAVAKLEAGRRKVSASELVRIAAALDRPIDWFVTESPPSVVSRRTDATVGRKSKALDQTIDRLARDVDFLESEGVLPSIEPLRLALPQTFDEATKAADEVRGAMQAGDGPIHDLQSSCENVGLLGFSLELGPDAGDAAYVAVGNWGVALINGSIDAGRRRFNLAHELGHHVFSDAYAPEVTIAPGSSTEQMVNAFAIHVLLPKSPVMELWHEFDTPRLAAVATGVRFRASWSAVCNQLRNLGLIDASERELLLARPPTGADFIELGERWTPELDPPSVPIEYGRRVLGEFKRGRLSSERTVELLWGAATEDELPEQVEVPLEGLRREFEPLP